MIRSNRRPGFTIRQEDLDNAYRSGFLCGITIGLVLFGALLGLFTGLYL